MVGQTISHYRVLVELGAGGMGVVYKAKDLKLKSTVALKFLPESLSCNPQTLERFHREAQAASALNHPNICTIYDIDEADDKTFITMELLEGRTLREQMAAAPSDYGWTYASRTLRAARCSSLTGRRVTTPTPH